MPRFEVRGSRYVFIDDDGNERPWPFPGHASSIIDVLKAHGGTATPTSRTRRSNWDGRDYEEITIDDPSGRQHGRLSLNSYLIDRGIESGMLIRNDDGSVSLNTEMAGWYEQYQDWQRQVSRDAAARRTLARDFEVPNPWYWQSYRD